MMGDDLIVTANVVVAWSPPSQVAGFAVTGYDVYVGTEVITDPYASPPTRNVQMFEVRWS